MFKISTRRMFVTMLATLAVVFASQIQAELVYFSDGTFNYHVTRSSEGLYTTNSVYVDGLAEEHAEDSELVIPAGLTYDGVNLQVHYISSGAFQDNQYITKLTLPNGVWVRESAFAGCANLTSVDIYDTTYKGSETTVYERAFENCVNLKSIDASRLYSLRDYSFSNTAIETLDFSDIYLYANALNGMSNLKSVTIKRLKTLGSNVFTNTGLESLTIKTVNCTLVKGMLSGTPIKYINIGEGSVTKSYPDGLFAGLTTLEEVTLRSGDIPTEAFMGCINLREVNMTMYERIGMRAFKGCTALTTLNVTHNSTKDKNYYSVGGIGSYAFMDCTNLNLGGETIYTTTVGKQAFYNCKSMESIIIRGTYSDKTLNAVDIGQEAFVGCDNLKSASLEVKTIEQMAFQNCTNLVDLELLEVVEIHNSAFKGCTGLTAVTIPGTTVKMDHSIFNGCDNITSFTLADSKSPLQIDFDIPLTVKNLYLGRELYHGYNGQPYDDYFDCTYVKPGYQIEKLVIGNEVTVIPSFKECMNLTDVKIGSSVTAIPEGCFDGTMIEEIVIPNSVKEIGVNAFRWCPNLTTVHIGSGVETLGQEAFSLCENLCAVNFAGSTLPSFENAPFIDPEFKINFYIDNVAEMPYEENVAQVWVDPETGEEWPCPPTLNWTAIQENYKLNYLVNVTDVRISEEQEYSIYSAGGEEISRTKQLYAVIEPWDASIPHVEWSSSDTDAATVDPTGLVTIKDPTKGYTISARALDSGGAYDEFAFDAQTTAIDEVKADDNQLIEVNGEMTKAADNNVYNIQGMLLKRNASQDYINSLPKGIYIISGKKVYVK